MAFKGVNDVPVAFLCSSDKELDSLIDYTRDISKGKDFVLLLENDEKLLDRLLPAYLNAYLRYCERIMRADTLRMEILLFVSKTLNIGNAIKEVGAKDMDSFIVFASNKNVFSKFSKISGINKIRQYKLDLKEDVSGKIAMTGLLEG